MRRKPFALAVAVACLTVGLAPGLVAMTSAQAAGIPDACRYNRGSALTTEPWPQKTLDFSSLQDLGGGQYTVAGHDSTGRPVTVGEPVSIAVIDSGFDPRNPVFAGIDASPNVNITPAIKGVYDCVGHGTEVVSVIAAQPNTSPMVGIAPRAHIVPIVYTNSETNGPQAPVLVQCLDYAIAHHVQVINLSLQSTAVTGPVLAALRAAEQAGIVVVAAGGNDQSDSTGPYYPAALSKTFSNVIAVGAVGQDGTAGSFNYGGSYIDVAAPGAGVPVAVRVQGFTTQQGTSFAAPFVSGTVALMLANHPSMTPQEVRNRLETTAVPPPGTSPNSQYGYGTIDPLLAVTSAQDDAVAVPSAQRGEPIAGPAPAAAPDRAVEHRALAAAVVLLGLAVLTVTGSAILRGRRSGPA